jgi:hypothetical protein
MGGIRRHGFQQSLNTTIGNAKRFMASEFIKRLEEKEAAPLLDLLHGAQIASSYFQLIRLFQLFMLLILLSVHKGFSSYRQIVFLPCIND